MEIEGIEVDQDGRPAPTCECGEQFSYPHVHVLPGRFLLEGLCRHCGRVLESIEVEKGRMERLFGPWLAWKLSGAGVEWNWRNSENEAMVDKDGTRRCFGCGGPMREFARRPHLEEGGVKYDLIDGRCEHCSKPSWWKGRALHQ